IQAAWLAQVRLPLGQSIEQVIDADHDELPLRENVTGQIHLGSAARHELRERVRRILASDSGLLTSTGWYTNAWIDRVVDATPQHFERAFVSWRGLFFY